MTSTREVRDEIARFLAGPAAEVLCLTGKWGVGKTYSWQRDLRSAQMNGALHNNRYAYVSLFGLNSLDDFKYAIFENTVSVDQIAQGPSHNTLVAGAHFLERQARQAAYLFRGVPYAKDILQGSKSAFLAVRDQLVTIDDLERHGKNLDLKDVLGLVTVLKEQRGCKIVLLLNEEELPNSSREDFLAQLEKVIDIRLTFDPTPAEAADIGVDRGTAVAELLMEFCPKLGIKNIRVIKKIERLSLQAAALLGTYDPLILRQAIQSITLFAWIKLQPRLAMPLDFVISHNSQDRRLLRDNERDAPPEHVRWGQLLTNYEFTMVDEFDHVVISGIDAGFYDESALKREADKIQKQLDHQKLDSAFGDAWAKYHDSFADNEDEIVAEIVPAFKSSVSVISAVNLSGTISLLKDLNHGKEALQLLAYYMAAHENEGRNFFDLSVHPFGGDVSDPDVRTAFAAKLTSFSDNRNARTILINIVLNSAWNESNLEFVANLSDADLNRPGFAGGRIIKVTRPSLRCRERHSTFVQPQPAVCCL